MDGLFLQTVEGLGDAPPVRTGCEIWEWLQAEKEEAARKIISEGPLSQITVTGNLHAKPNHDANQTPRS